jgi:hypothetical protein
MQRLILCLAFNIMKTKFSNFSTPIRIILQLVRTVNLLDAGAVVRVQREFGGVDGGVAPVPGEHERLLDRRVRQAERVSDLVRSHEEQTRS